MSPERLAQIREHVRQGRVFVSDGRALLDEVDRLSGWRGMTDWGHSILFAHGMTGRQSMMDHIDIVIDGPPGSDPGRFVEVEDSTGASIGIGEWIERDDGHWALRIPGPPVTEGAARISEERGRQIGVEGFTPDHDREHDEGELLAAALCYAKFAMRQMAGESTDLTLMQLGWREDGWALWPWEVSWWKPSDDPARNLEKAGALIAAEIDRGLHE